jgi:hypothetical protein
MNQSIGRGEKEKIPNLNTYPWSLSPVKEKGRNLRHCAVARGRKRERNEKKQLSDRSVSVPLLFFALFIFRHVVQPPSIPLTLHPQQIPTPLPLQHLLAGL